MAILVFVECADGIIKKSSKEAISYAHETGKITGDNEIIAIVGGEYDDSLLASLGTNGATTVLNFADKSLNVNHISVFAALMGEVLKKYPSVTIVFSKSSFADNIAGRIAGMTGAAIVSNVISLPDVSNGFVVKKSIFTGKAVANIAVDGNQKILVIKKNTVRKQELDKQATIEKLPWPDGVEADEKITGSEKATGGILLEDAEIVVSGGRGLKGPENWGMIEDLASALGAATGCSKPVSDMGWRPHHEHVGQTGVKVSPNLYIAVGISGAIQHLAGVNASKVLVAINKDPEAPFFKAADYGIVGDAFDIVPRLAEKVKSL